MVRGPDVSFYQDDDTTPQQIDFDVLKSVSDFVIIRAGQNTWIDSDFKVNWKMAKDAKIPRGSYWFYDSRSSPESQAKLWAGLLGSDLGELPLFADYEENYGGAYGGWRNLKIFLETMKSLCPNKELGIYTAYYYWKDHTIGADLEYFHQYTLWIANYGVNVPSVPAPWGADEWKFWQYTSKGDGSLYGVESSTIDLNVYNGTLSEFHAEYSIDSEPVPMFKEFVFEIKPENIVRAYVTKYSSNQTVAKAAQDFHDTCQVGNHSLVINGDGWRVSGVANGDWVSDGMWKHVQPNDSYSPRITFDKYNKGAIAGARNEYWYPAKILDYNAFGLTRRLVKEGKINPAYSDSGELNSRTAFGFKPDGTLVIYVCDGWDINRITQESPKGRTIKETGEILITYGCVEAGDGDGGGSVTLAMDGIVVNDYNDDGVKIMRPVVNHLCLELKFQDDEPSEGDDVMAEVKVVTTTKYYMYPGESARDTIPAGTKFFVIGTTVHEGAEWVRIDYNDLNPWAGKWVIKSATAPVTDVPPVEPPVEPPVDTDYFVRYDKAGNALGRYELVQ